MGLFSGKKKTKADVSSSLMMPKKERASTIKDATAQYIQDNPRDMLKDSMVSYVDRGMASSVLTGARRVHGWLENSNYSMVYAESTYITGGGEQKAKQKIDTALKNIYGLTVNVNYSYTTVDYNLFHLAKQILQDDYGWIPHVNTIHVNGNHYFLDDVIVHSDSSEADNIEPLGVAFTDFPTPFRQANHAYNGHLATAIVDNTQLGDYFTVEVCFPARTGTMVITEVSENYNDSGIYVDTTRTILNSYAVDENNARTDYDTKVLDNSGDLINSVRVRVDDPSGSFVLTYQENAFTGVCYKCSRSIQLNYDKYSLVPYGYEISQWLKDGNTLNEPLPNMYMFVEYYRVVNGIREYSLTGSAALSVNIEDEMLEPEGEFGVILPNLYLRKDKTLVDKEDLPALYHESRRYARKLHFPYRDFKKEISATIEDNEQSDSIYSSYLQFGASILTKDQEVKKYILWFLEKVFKQTAENRGIVLTPTSSNVSMQHVSINLGDRLKLTVFHVNKLTMNLITGKPKEVGEVWSEHPYGADDSVVPPVRGNKKIIGFFKQVSDTQYVEYVLDGALTVRQVTKRNKSFIDLKDALDDTNNNVILVPIDNYYLRKEVPIFKHAEHLLYESTWISTDTVVEIEGGGFFSSWIFKLLIIVVSVVVSIYTGGAGFSLMSVLEGVGTSLALNFGMKMVIKMMPASLLKSLGVILTIVAVMYGAYSVLTNLSKSFAILQMNISKLLTMAQKGIGLYQTGVAKGIQEDSDWLTKQQKLLEEKQEALAYNPINVEQRDPINLVGSFIVLGETTEGMITRTINTDIGTATIDFVHNSVDYALALPTSEDVMRQLAAKFK